MTHQTDWRCLKRFIKRAEEAALELEPPGPEHPALLSLTSDLLIDLRCVAVSLDCLPREGVLDFG